jgi:hypothetical protein
MQWLSAFYPIHIYHDNQQLFLQLHLDVSIELLNKVLCCHPAKKRIVMRGGQKRIKNERKYVKEGKTTKMKTATEQILTQKKGIVRKLQQRAKTFGSNKTI